MGVHDETVQLESLAHEIITALSVEGGAGHQHHLWFFSVVSRNIFEQSHPWMKCPPPETCQGHCCPSGPASEGHMSSPPRAECHRRELHQNKETGKHEECTMVFCSQYIQCVTITEISAAVICDQQDVTYACASHPRCYSATPC